MALSEAVIIRDFKDLDDFCHVIVKQFGGKTLMLIRGDLGVGKTELVKRMLQKLNVTEVSSPTFALHHSYNSDSIRVEHFDLYRIQNDDDLESVGFWDIVQSANCEGAKKLLIIVEWPEILGNVQLDSTWKLLRLAISIERNAGKEVRRFVLS